MRAWKENLGRVGGLYWQSYSGRSLRTMLGSRQVHGGGEGGGLDGGGVGGGGDGEGRPGGGGGDGGGLGDGGNFGGLGGGEKQEPMPPESTHEVHLLWKDGSCSSLRAMKYSWLPCLNFMTQ